MELWRCLASVQTSEYTKWMADSNKEYGNLYPEFDDVDVVEPVPGNPNHLRKGPYNSQRRNEYVAAMLALAQSAGVPFGHIQTRILNAYETYFGRAARPPL